MLYVFNLCINHIIPVYLKRLKIYIYEYFLLSLHEIHKKMKI